MDKELIQKSRDIAVFMGATSKDAPSGDPRYILIEFKDWLPPHWNANSKSHIIGMAFHTSMDWLYPVWVKVLTVYKQNPEYSKVLFPACWDVQEMFRTAEEDILKIFNALHSFIVIINQQKQTT